MPKSIRSFDRMIIPAPCNADWDSMIGNERVRFCEHCKLHVTDLSSLTRTDAIRLVERSRGGVCVRYIVGPSGGVVTRNMPEPLYRIGRRVSKIAAGAFSATLSISTVAAQTRPANSARQSTNVVESVQTAEKVEPELDEFSTSVSGTVTTYEGAPISEARIVLVDLDTGEERFVTSSVSGGYVFQFLPAADYLIWARKPAFETQRETITVRVGMPAGMDFKLIEKSRHMSILGGAMAFVRNEEDPLFKAVSDNDLAAVQKLAFTVRDINATRPSSGESLLSAAVGHANREMIKVLMLAGADVNVRNGDGRTALMALSDRATAEIARDLIDAGAKMNARDNYGDSALIIAAGSANPSVLKELLKAGARVDAIDSAEETALFAAARGDKVESVRVLVEAGADVNAKNEEGLTPIMAMLSSGNVETFAALVEKGAQLDIKDDEGRTPLMLAAVNDDPHIVDLLIQTGPNIDAIASDGSTALMLAAQHGPAKTVSLLIYAGAHLEIKDDDGRTALLRAALSDSVEGVVTLLTAGADFTARDKQGKSALGLAREADNQEVVALLKQRGAPE